MGREPRAPQFGAGEPDPSGGLASSQMRNALKGLTREQRIKVKAGLPPTCHFGTGGRGSSRAGWSMYREPSTLNPPTTLRLLRRDSNGKVQEVISITEKGVTK